LGDKIEEIRQTVDDAIAELFQNRMLSQGTAKKLDNLYRMLK